MPEIPATSDLYWQSAMNSAPLERHSTTRGERLGCNQNSEPVYGYRNPEKRQPLPSAVVAEMADLVDDVFTELRDDL